MGYSKSLVTLQRFYEYVQPLERGEPHAWLVAEPGYADTLAYKVREALYIARLHEKEYPLLAAAADKFVIEVVSPIKVQARLSGVPTESRILASHGELSPQHGESASPVLGRMVATSGEQTAFTIIDAWKNSQPNQTPISFPSARLDYEQLRALWNWAQTWKPKPLMIIYDEDSGALTLGPPEADVIKYAWTPNVEHMPVVEEKPKSFPIPPKRY